MAVASQSHFGSIKKFLKVGHTATYEISQSHFGSIKMKLTDLLSVEKQCLNPTLVRLKLV